MTGFDLPLLVNTVIVAFAVLGGVMASYSGIEATIALVAGMPREELAFRINRGVGGGFMTGAPLAVITLIVFLDL